jgi:hypothetical protein
MTQLTRLHPKDVALLRWWVENRTRENDEDNTSPNLAADRVALCDPEDWSTVADWWNEETLRLHQPEHPSAKWLAEQLAGVVAIETVDGEEEA